MIILGVPSDPKKINYNQMKKALLKVALLLSASTMAVSAQTPELILTPNWASVHLQGNITGDGSNVKNKGFSFRKQGTTAWTDTGYTDDFAADILYINPGVWEFRAWLQTEMCDIVYSNIEIYEMAICCETDIAMEYPPVTDVNCIMPFNCLWCIPPAADNTGKNVTLGLGAGGTTAITFLTSLRHTYGWILYVLIVF